MISRRSIFFIVIFSFLGLIAGLFISRQIKLKNPTAGLKIETLPESQVFIDNKEYGSTPFEQMFSPGEVMLKLVPKGSQPDLKPYQAKLKLSDNVFTVVRRDFGESDVSSAGESITLLPVSGISSSLSLVSDPDSASVLIDNQPQGFTPLSLDSITAGSHQVDISAPGFKTRTVSIKIVSGLKAQIVVKLSASGPAAVFPSVGGGSSPEPASASAQVASNVIILSTPTGFLRVRSAPSRDASEVTRVKPGETYQLLEKQSGWVLIKLIDPDSSTTSGWVSSEYVKSEM